MESLLMNGIEHHLYTLISQHLLAHPTSSQSATLVRVPGVPPPDPNKPYPTPAIPKGWKMSSILPYYSPGLTGGGVSENFFKEMMAEMQGQIPGMPNMAAMEGPSGSGSAVSGEGKPKKEKKKKIKV
jgi:signal recognition particle subunit SRP19